jgi:cell division protein FtsB
MRNVSSKGAVYFWHFFVAIIIVFLVVSCIGTYIKNSRFKNYALSIKKEIFLIQKENEKLQKHIYLLSSDPIYREAVIRQELKMAYEGEVVVKKSP